MEIQHLEGSESTSSSNSLGYLFNDKVGGSCFSSEEESTFDPKEYFKCYDFYEIYDPNKDYPQGRFELDLDLGFGKRRYKTCLNNLLMKPSGRRVEYIVYEEILEADECIRLARYCQCDRCLTPWYNPFKLLMCDHCYCCLWTGSPSQEVIAKTREYISKKRIFHYTYAH